MVSNMLMDDTMMARKETRSFFGVTQLPTRPTINVPKNVISVINNLILSQNVNKTMSLLGAKLTFIYKGEHLDVNNLDVYSKIPARLNLVEIADATSDIVVVSKGTQASYGVKDVNGYDDLPDMKMIKEYMDVVCSQTIRTTPTEDIGDKDRLLRAKLIVEESLELLMQGLGQTLEVNTVQGRLLVDASEIKNFEVVLDKENMIVDADELELFLLHINLFAKSVDAVFGIPSDSVILDEVMRSNIDKIWDDGKAHFNEAGKNIKPPNHQPPNIRRVLVEHGWDEK